MGYGKTYFSGEKNKKTLFVDRFLGGGEGPETLYFTSLFNDLSCQQKCILGTLLGLPSWTLLNPKPCISQCFLTMSEVSFLNPKKPKTPPSARQDGSK